MTDLATIPGIRHDGLHWTIELPGLRDVGRRYRELELEAERDEKDELRDRPLVVDLDAEPNEHVRSVSEWLLDHQGEILNELRPALVEMYQWMKDDPAPDERIWFPDGPAEELALDRFELQEVSIAPERNWITFSFDTPSGHLQEHGCMALLVDGRLATFGTGDDLLIYAENHR